MIKGALHKTKPAYATASEIGSDYLDLIMELEDGEEIRVSMPVKAMKCLGAMMVVVAQGIERRNITRN